jgi:hypothetical protein
MTSTEDVIKLAIQAAGTADDLIAWKSRVNALIPEIVVMLGERSLQRKAAERLADASVFTGDYLGYEYEDTSTRCIVKLFTGESRDHPDGIETIRTDRTDSSSGKMMRRKLDSLPPGCRVAAWKVMETAGQNTKVRVLGHIEFIGSKTPASAGTFEKMATAPSVGHAEPDLSVSTEKRDQLVRLLQSLTAEQKVTVHAMCKQAGIPNMMNPVGREDDVLAMITAAKSGFIGVVMEEEEPF